MLVLFVVCLFNYTATTCIYTCLHTLSLHDALPISYQRRVSVSAGAYGFRLIDLAVATAVPADNSLVEGVMTPASATAVYSFAGAAGDRLFLDVRTALSSGSMRIIHPYGRDSVSIASFAHRELTLPVAGPYTLPIERRVWSAGATEDSGFAPNRLQDPEPPA